MLETKSICTNICPMETRGLFTIVVLKNLFLLKPHLQAKRTVKFIQNQVSILKDLTWAITMWTVLESDKLNIIKLRWGKYRIKTHNSLRRRILQDKNSIQKSQYAWEEIWLLLLVIPECTLGCNNLIIILAIRPQKDSSRHSM